MKHVVVVGGGTAGHVLPAIPVIENCLESGFKVSFIGTSSGLEKGLLEETKVDFFSIPTGKLNRYFTTKNVVEFFGFTAGLFAAFFIILKLKPQVIFSKGGFVSVPVVLVGWLLKVPIVAHESDRTPGLANRIAFPFLSTYCTSFREHNPSLGVRQIYTGSPIRSEIMRGNSDRGKELLNFRRHKPVLLVTGGSLGSEFLNELVRLTLNELIISFNVYHVCGRGKVVETEDESYKQVEYVSEGWGDILASADVVVSRAGANALFELLSLKKVCLFIPLSRKASRGDQIDNALYAFENKFSNVKEEEGLTSNIFFQEVLDTYKNRIDYLDALEEFQVPAAADLIFQEISILI